MMKVCIATESPTSELYHELRDMLFDVLSTLGYLPVLTEDEDREALDADVLLMVGGIGFDAYAKLFTSREGRKPITILFLLEPLPPPTLGERAEEIGLRAAKVWRRVKMPLGKFARLIEPVLPISVLRRVEKAISWSIFLGFKKQMAKSPQQAFEEFDAFARHRSMERYWWIKRHFLEGWIDHVFVSTVPKMEFLTSRGIPVELVPFGYHPGMGEILGMDRDIDVLFIGNVEGRRRQPMLDVLRRRLESKGINLLTVEHDCYGKQRTELLNRARISLDLANYPWELSGIRFLISMGTGALVVSEPLYNPSPFKVGEHFVQASFDDLPDMIAHYLVHEGEREAIVRSANNFITRELTLQKTVSQIMGALGADSALPTGYMRRGD